MLESAVNNLTHTKDQYLATGFAPASNNSATSSLLLSEQAKWRGVMPRAPSETLTSGSASCSVLYFCILRKAKITPSLGEVKKNQKLSS